jgi:2-polyprenyl-6-methoxyphenol hydroxylase-like FAD-dependent oxidoreductase
MTSIGTDVLVVGAGPVGLTLGCELLLHGLSCRLIDLLDAPVIYSKAAVAHARTLEIFEALGVAEAVIARSKLIHGMSAYASGKRVMHVLLGEMDSPFPNIYGISQHDTEAILAERFVALGGRIERGCRLESLTQDGEGVSATLVRDPGSREELRTRWLVGCDGAHSTVRKAVGIHFDGSPYEEKIIQTDVRVKWPRHIDDDEILAFVSPDGPIGCFPFFQDGRCRVIKMYMDTPPEGEPTLATFQSLLEAHVPGVELSDPAWIIGFRIHHRLASRYRVDRVFIAGDAAHIHSPVGGQGMNTGIQDVHNLAWKLALVTRGVALPELLDSYEAERRPLAEELLRGTDLAMRAAQKVISLRSPLAQSLRNGLMTFVSRLDFVRSNMAQTMSMVDRHYRTSSIVTQHREPIWRVNIRSSKETETPDLAAWSSFGSGPEPGDRAPDVAYADAGEDRPERLFARLDATRHTLLLFDGEAATEGGYRNLREIAARVQARCGDAVRSILVLPRPQLPEAAGWDGAVLLDAEQRLHARYGARAECLYLVRPDGHIAYRSQPADGNKLLAYLDTLFAPR